MGRFHSRTNLYGMDSAGALPQLEQRDLRPSQRIGRQHQGHVQQTARQLSRLAARRGETEVQTVRAHGEHIGHRRAGVQGNHRLGRESGIGAGYRRGDGSPLGGGFLAEQPHEIARTGDALDMRVDHAATLFDGGYGKHGERDGSYFHQECERAKRGESDKQFAFVPWFEIEMYTLPIDDYDSFIGSLTDYERMLWHRGATLEAIAWYRQKRKEYARHADMMAEYPSDDIEAFCYSGERVFDPTLVEKLRRCCCPPRFEGDIHGKEPTGKQSLQEIELETRPEGPLKIWEYPAKECDMRDRYLAVVDIGGRSDTSDYSVIAVFDRYWMLDGGPAEVVAQWRGHIDHDLLAWKSAQIAAYYQNALLVIESNTLETEHDDSEHSAYILDTLSRYYNNLYARQSPPDSIGQKPPSRWGFHMNRATKALVIDAQKNALREGSYIEHDTQACYEHDVYERKSNGSYGAMEGHHDDILITRCIGNYICSRELPSASSKGHRSERIINESSI